MPIAVTMHLLTLDELAAAWRVSRKTILRWRREGRIREVARGARNQLLFSPMDAPPNEMEPWQVQALFGVSRRTIEEWAEKGLLEYNLTGGGIRRYHTGSVFKLLMECKIELLDRLEAIEMFDDYQLELTDLIRADKVAFVRIDHQVLYTSFSIAAALGVPNPFYLTSNQVAALAERNKSRVLYWCQEGMVRCTQPPLHKRCIPASSLPLIISHTWVAREAAEATGVPLWVAQVWYDRWWLDPDPDRPGPPDKRKRRQRDTQRA